MDYQQFSADLPRRRTLVFTSAEENQQTMEEWGVEQQLRQLGPGKFRCDLAMRSTEHGEFFADRFNKAFSMRLALPRSAVGFLFPRAASGQFLASGENVANDKLLVFANGAGADIVASDMVGSECFVIPQARLAELTNTLCPTCALPEGITVVNGGRAQLDKLRDAILQLTALPEQDTDPEEVSHVIAATIAYMYHSSRDWKPEGSTIREARRRIAKRAQDFIEAHYREPIGAEDLCRETGVGARMIQRSFRDYFDLTVTDYLRAVRLDAAHRDLAAAHPSRGIIAKIASDNGIHHLGRFSIAFRERFGESPSATLTRRPGQKF